MRADHMEIRGAEDIPIRKSQSCPWAKYDALVISTGLAIIRPYGAYSDIQIEKIIEANLIVPLLAARRYIVERQSENIGGRIIFIGSYAHDHVLSNSVPYCAAKAGLAHATRALAWDMTSKGFLIYCVHPHSVSDTPMTEKVIAEIAYSKGLSLEQAREYWKKDLRLHARLTKGEISQVVEHLVTGTLTPHLSGANIDLYGGER